MIGKLKLIVLLLLMLICMLAGYWVLGSFIDAGGIGWFKEQPEIVRSLVGFEFMIIDKLISASVFMFGFWALAFYGYERFETNLDVLNKFFPLAWIFAESIATVFLALASLLVGLCIYGWMNYAPDAYLYVTTAWCMFLLCMGFYARYYSVPQLKESDFLRAYATKLGHICSVLAFGAFSWGIVAEPVRVLLLLMSYMNS